MKDAGDPTGRADSQPSGPSATAPATGKPGALSKRAARRRRKRRSGSEGAEARADRPSAPPPQDRPKPADGAADARSGAKAGARPAGQKRRKRPGRGKRPDDTLRGVRQQTPAEGRPQGGHRRGGQPGAGQRADGGRPGGHAPRADGGDRRDGDRRDARRGARGAPVYAALDLGTNNCRLLIAEPQERGFRVVDAFSRIVRLGEGIGRSGRLSEAAMDRAVEALAVCREKMGDFNVRRMRLIATEACRAAENGPLFLERVRAETGLSLEIVNRETEARLAVAGCATLVDPRAEGVVLFDIGGGSSELVWLDLRRRGEAKGFALTRFIKAWTSLPVGVVTLSERHGGVTVTPAVFEEMVAEVATMIDAFPDAAEIGPMIAEGRVHLLGTSGTVTTLAGMHLGLKRYDRRRVDGVWLSAGDIDGMIGRLLDMEFADRVANPCIGADRADLVLAGCAILEAIRRRWPCERLRVADRGLREGILVELMARDGVWRRPPPAARPQAPAAP